MLFKLIIMQAFHMDAQDDRKIARVIATDTQVHGAALTKTISYLTLLFLPGTFVCVRPPLLTVL